MNRRIAIYLLVFTVLFQSATPLACTLIVAYQLAKNGTAHSCCSPAGKPLQTPEGMPEDQCCFKRGSLLSKLTVPHGPEMPLPSESLIALLPAADFAAKHELGHNVALATEHHPPPPRRAVLCTLRI